MHKAINCSGSLQLRNFIGIFHCLFGEYGVFSGYINLKFKCKGCLFYPALYYWFAVLL